VTLTAGRSVDSASPQKSGYKISHESHGRDVRAYMVRGSAAIVIAVEMAWFLIPP
jgi:hypothetical protein